MAKRLTTEDHLATLRTLRGQEPSETGITTLQNILANKSVHGLILKMVAELAQKWDAKSLAPSFVAAAEAAAPPAGTKRDPGCEGKAALLHALIEWDASFPDFYLKAARWIQMEPVQNKSIDTAAECRGLAAIGIASTRADSAIPTLVDLLVDPETPARLRAAMALAIWRGPESVPLLRLKALTGDDDPDVMGEVLSSLLKQEPREQLPFVTTFLENKNSRIVEAAALAIGQSRRPEALAPLLAAWNKFHRDPIHTTLLMAIALLRFDEAFAWLLKEFVTATPALAADIRDALGIYRGDPRAEAQIQAIETSRATNARKATP